jgi:hypothetical protein
MAVDRPASSSTSPAKTRHDCKTCTSPRRAEIEARLARGESMRGISAWLLEAHGEAIRHDALGRHWKAHRAGAPDPPRSAPPPASARVATVTQLRPRDTRQQPRQPPQRPDRPTAPPAEPAAEVHVWKPDLSGLDELALELFNTVQSVGRSVRGAPDKMSFAQSTLMVGATRELGKLVQIRHMITTGGKPGGQQQLTPADGLKALLGNSPPPAIEGDEPDGTDDEAEDDLLRPAPRWADGEPDGEPGRQVVEAPAEEATPPVPAAATRTPDPEPAMAGPAQGPRPWKLWQPPRR